jgi:hypothetical protein
MRRFSTSRFIHEVMLPVTLVAFMAACHKWSTVQEDPRDFVGQNDAHRVRVEPRSRWRTCATWTTEPSTDSVPGS